MNGLLILLSIESWKPVLSALVLPPVPFFLLILLGARWLRPRRGAGWLVTLLGLSGLWLSSCAGVGHWLERWALRVPAALSAADIDKLKTAVRDEPHSHAIVVLGGGADALAYEYRAANLHAPSLERLRYGLWLSRQTGAPVAFSGGVGWAASRDAAPEAQVASRIAAVDFGLPLKWLEDRSRDTRENAAFTLDLLKRERIKHIVLVSHAVHLPRALRAFEAAAQAGVTIQAAPIGLTSRQQVDPLDWLPSAAGYKRVNSALHELLGLLAGS